MLMNGRKTLFLDTVNLKKYFENKQKALILIINKKTLFYNTFFYIYLKSWVIKYFIKLIYLIN